MIAARGVLSMAAKFRASYLRNFYELGRKNVEPQSKPEQPIAYLIPAGQARDEAVAKLIASLVGQGIEVYRLDRELHLTFGPQVLQRINPPGEKLGTYKTIIANSTMSEVPLGSYIVFLSQ